MLPPDPNNTYIKPPPENQILEFSKTLGYDEDPETKMIFVSTMVATRLYQPWRAILSVLNRCLAGKDSSWDTVRLPILEILWGIVHSANLEFASLIWDEFEWKTVERSSRPSKMSKLLYTRFTKLIIDYILLHNKSIRRRSDFKLHSLQDDHPITKLLSITNGDYKFGMEVPDAMISDEIKKKAGLESLRQKKQPVARERSSAAHNKYYSSFDTDSDTTLYSSSSDKTEKSANKTDDADESDMDLFDDNPYGDDDATSASEVPLGIHVDVLETKTLMQEMFLDKNAHHIPSLPTKKILYPITTPQPNSLQAKAKKLMHKAKKNIRKINFKKAVA
nr:hypothetical protein [Tanacetum cinerariifolium]